MSNRIQSPKDCMDCRKVISYAQSRGANVRQNGGSHAVVEYNGHVFTIPAHKTGIGLASKIFKWLVRAGLLIWLFISVKTYLEFGCIPIPLVGYLFF